MGFALSGSFPTKPPSITVWMAVQTSSWILLLSCGTLVLEAVEDTFYSKGCLTVVLQWVVRPPHSQINQKMLANPGTWETAV